MTNVIIGNGDSDIKYYGIYPAQCSCGHLYLEKYEFSKPTEQGNIGFCWCGFCRTRHNVKAKEKNNG